MANPYRILAGGVPWLMVWAAGHGRAADCNGNGVDDAIDLRQSYGLPAFHAPGFPQLDKVAAGNVNGEQGIDIVAMIRDDPTPPSGKVVVLDNLGEGQFDPGWGLGSMAGVTDFVLADLNSDGRLDLAVLQGGTQRVTVFPGGAGTFVSSSDDTRIDVGSEGPIRILAADVWGDGRIDLVTANRTENTVAILENRTSLGGDWFQVVRRFPVPAEPQILAAGELDGSGDRTDLIVSNVAETVILWNVATSLVRPPVRTTLPLNYMSTVEIADFDGDDLQDLAVAEFAAIQILTNAGSRSFTTGPRLDARSFMFDLALADLEPDGDTDLVAPQFLSPGVLVFRNEGDGTFAPEEPLAEGLGRFTAEVADLNGDGAQDIITDADGEENVAVFLAHAVSKDLNTNGIPDECEEPSEPEFRRGDSNQDGQVDISDGIRILEVLFVGGVTLDCRDSADTNDDGGVDVSDGVAVFSFLFSGGSRPPAPGPDDCGGDPTGEDEGCGSYDAAGC